MRRSRVSLLGLWLGGVCRLLADLSLVRITTAPFLPAETVGGWLLVVAAACLAGVIGRAWPIRGTLLGCAGLVLLTTVAFPWFPDPTWAVLGVIGLAAVEWPLRAILMSAIATENHLPLTRLGSLLVLGTLLALSTAMFGWPFLAGSEWEHVLPSIPSEGTIVGLNALALVLLLVVEAPAGIAPVPSMYWALASFVRDAGRALASTELRPLLLGASVFHGFLAAGVLLALEASRARLPAGPTLDLAVPLLLGTAFGAAAAALQKHPYRCRGLIAHGMLGLALSMILTALAPGMSWVGAMIGASLGLTSVGFLAAFQEAQSPRARVTGLAILGAGTLAAAASTRLACAGADLQAAVPLWVGAVVAVLAAILALRCFFRATLEVVTEVALWPCYRIRSHGPGVERFPRRGPVLVLANHTAYMDPLWMSKVLPRRMTPMMTSVFYDLPVLRWLMVHVVKAIRVQWSYYRREAPEIQEAVAALDRGECVLLYPEGWLRRHGHEGVRQFGQGIWHILRQRPSTPVVVCWVEGGWGSFFSHAGGPPMVNKRMDLWRRIDIAVEEPRVLDPALLEQHRETRNYLMRVCLDARRHLGLEVPAWTEPTEDNDKVEGGG